MIAGGNNGNTKKNLNAELNLTPFIDLLSTCICFLLISAVWIEIGNLEIKQTMGKSADPLTQKNDSFNLDLTYEGPTKLKLKLKQNGKLLKDLIVSATDSKQTIQVLENAIKGEIVPLIPAKAYQFANAAVTPTESVNYGQLVSTLDILRKNKIVNIGVTATVGKK